MQKRQDPLYMLYCSHRHAPSVTGLTIADALREQGFASVPVLVATPGGGLVCVVDSAGMTLLDKSYVRGTALCSLEEKIAGSSAL